MANHSLVVAQTYEQSRVFDVAVILDPAARRDPESIGCLRLKGSSSVSVPLRELTEVYSTTGRYVILHDGTLRR